MAIDYIIFPGGSRIYFGGHVPKVSDLPSRNQLKASDGSDTEEFIKVLQENRRSNGEEPVDIHAVFK